MARLTRRRVIFVLLILAVFLIGYFSHIVNFEIMHIWLSPRLDHEKVTSEKRTSGDERVNKDDSKVNATLNTTVIDAHSVSRPHTSKPTPQTILRPLLARNSTVLTRTATSWKNEDGVCDLDTGDFMKATLRSPAGNTPIYVYSIAVDQWVSGNIIRQGIWERSGVNLMHKLMQKHPDADFIDLGANVGVYGLTFAKMGRRVILIDPLLSNVRRLCKSVRDGGFSNEVYVIHNAMSDGRFQVSFGKYKGNVGGTYVKEVTTADTETKSTDAEVAQAVQLDDLLEIFNFTKVIMKVDVETHETRALQGGDKFFSTVDVIAVQVEWNAHKKDGGDIIKFLVKHNMKPYGPSIGSNVLDVNSFHKWPGDILWRKV